MLWISLRDLWKFSKYRTSGGKHSDPFFRSNYRSCSIKKVLLKNSQYSQWQISVIATKGFQCKNKPFCFRRFFRCYYRGSYTAYSQNEIALKLFLMKSIHSIRKFFFSSEGFFSVRLCICLSVQRQSFADALQNRCS